jgi:hypothetical protein
MRRNTLASIVAIAIAVGSCTEVIGPPDSITPPGNVTVTLVGPNSVRVTWTAPPEADFVESYSVFRDAVKIGESKTTSYVDDAVVQGVTYKYRVSANGQLGIVSELSSESAAATIIVPDVTPPTVSSVFPGLGVTGVPLASSVSAVFSEPMDPATITSATFLLKTAAGALIPGTVTYTAATRTAQFTPTAALPNGATVSGTITTGVKDVAGNGLQSDFALSFKTLDEVPPSIVATLPAAGATGVGLMAGIVVTFDEEIDPLTLNVSTFTVTATSGGTPVTGSVSYNAATRQGIFNPSANLAETTEYTATIAAGVKDQAGNAMGAAFSFSFTTVDVTRPKVVSVSPMDGATDVALNAAIKITFSEAMDPASINASSIALRLTSSGAFIGGAVTYDAATMTAIFTPSAGLTFSTGYTITSFVGGAKDLAGNAVTSNFVSTFVTTDAPDTTAPSVVSVSPLDGAVDVPITTAVSVSFSEAMNPATIDGTTVTLKNAATSAAIPATVAYDAGSKTATLTPSSSLSFGNAYALTVSTGASDLAGNGLGGTFASTFTTAAAPDNTPPSVLSTVPVDAATNVSVLTPITVTFSEPMNPATINTSTIVLKLAGPGTVISGSVGYDGATRTAAFTPAAGTLAFSTTYTITVSGAADVAGNALASAFIVAFTTQAAPDLTPPTVTGSSPANGAISIATSVAPTITFSEAMNPATINGTTITLRVTATSAAVSGTVSYSSATNTATFTPSASLSGATGYTLSATTGAKDLAGNSLASTFTSSFTTTDATPPGVVSTSPLNGAVNVPVNTVVTVTFSEPMNASTINGSTITLRVTATSAAVPGTVSYNGGTNTATFTPTASLSGPTGYTLTVTTGAKDLAGNSLASPFTSSFTTADATPPTVGSTSPVNGSVGVLITSVVTVTFSEPMNPATINTSTITVKRGPAPDVDEGTVTYDAATRTATFTPTFEFPYNSPYTITVTTGVKDVAGNQLASNFTSTFQSIQYVFSVPYFQGTTVITGPSQPEIHVHLKFSQDGHTLGRASDCAPLPTASCDLLPRNQAGADAIGTLDDTGLAATVTQISGTFTDPGISFTFTLQNGRTFSFSGTVANSQTMTGTMTGATLPPGGLPIVLDRFVGSGVSAARAERADTSATRY